MYNLKKLQQNYLETIVDCTKKTFLPITGVYILTQTVLVLLMILIFVGVIGANIDDLSNVFSGRNLTTALTESIGLLIGGFSILFILILLIYSWFYNFGIYLSHQYLARNELNVALAFEKSFTKKIFSTFFIFLITGGLFFALFIAFILLIAPFDGGISPIVSLLIMLLIQLVLMVFFIRFSIAVPISLLSNEPVIASIGASFKSISLKNALRYAGILFITLLGMGVMLLIVYGIITAIFSSMGTLGVILSSIFQLILYGFALALMFHAIVDLYYKHFASIENKALDLEENMLIDELN